MTGPRIYPDNTAVSRTPRAAPGLLDLLRSLLQKGQQGAEAVEQRIASGLPEGTLRGTIPEYIAGPGGAPRIVGKVGEGLKKLFGIVASPGAAKRATSLGPFKRAVINDESMNIIDLQKRIEETFWRPVVGRVFNTPRTKAFDDWRGQSKLIDESGESLPLFHGSDQVLDVIEPPGRGLIFAADNIKTARNYAFNQAIRSGLPRQSEQIYPLYGRMERPLDMRHIPGVPGIEDDPALYEALGQFGLTPKYRRSQQGNGALWRMMHDLKLDRDKLRRGGYDGTIFKDLDYFGDEHLSYAFANPNQLKSAIGNSGAFSRNRNNIALGLAGLTTAASTRNRDKP